MKMNESMFDDIIDTAQDCIFWKDKDRRFVGVNKAFLEFYGFESTEVLIGKTDEDMGWHSDPEPFKQDELRVLAGESTYKVQGKCMVNGEERDIIASKRPIYRGDEIVGLVGSFSDVTEVMRRKKDKEKDQVMYTIEDLRKYPYFDRLLDEVSMDEVLDSLTGIISRAYIFDFAKSLISSRTPFTFMILDLDNFKNINDKYGHHAGDLVLMDVSKQLAQYTKGFGVVGRFGGDELLIINLRDLKYRDKEKFFETMYDNKRILRKNLHADGQSVFVTGTAGCATYPDDAGDYESLFTEIDKTLYAGKNRGRNCFTIFTEEEHADLDVREIARTSSYLCMHGLVQIFEGHDSFADQLKAAMVLLEQELQISQLYFVNENGLLSSFDDPTLIEDVSDIGELMTEDIFADSTLHRVKQKSPLLYRVLNELDVQAPLIVKVGTGDKTLGYLICAESRNQRLWQEDEFAIVFFLARECAFRLS